MAAKNDKPKPDKPTDEPLLAWTRTIGKEAEDEFNAERLEAMKPENGGTMRAPKDKATLPDIMAKLGVATDMLATGEVPKTLWKYRTLLAYTGWTDRWFFREDDVKRVLAAIETQGL